MCQSVSDFLAFILTIPIIIYTFRELRYEDIALTKRQ